MSKLKLYLERNDNMQDLIEIRWHGRGGQGAKTASLLLADAAFNTGKYIQGFPEYGPERMGAPITAYNRISNKPITIHSNIYEPDYVVVVDDTLLETVDVTAGLKSTGAIVINTTKSPECLKSKLNGFDGDIIQLMQEKFLWKLWVDIFQILLCLLLLLKLAK